MLRGRSSSTPAFTSSALDPRVALISVGRGNLFGHPAPEVISRYEQAGAEVFRTDRDAAINLETDGRDVFLRTLAGTDVGADGAAVAVAALARCHALSRSAALAPWTVRLRAAKSSSSAAKRRVNLSLAPRSTASGSSPRVRARLAIEKRRSPSSSAVRAWPSWSALRNSRTSSSILSTTSAGVGQSKPTAATRVPIS